MEMEQLGSMKLSRRAFLKALGLATGLTVLGSPGLSARAQGPILIGVLGPEGIFVGEGIKNGALLAAQEINAAGGVNGQEIQLLFRDTRMNPAIGIQSVQDLVITQGAKFLVGLFRSEVVVSIAQQIYRFGVPLLITGATEPAPTNMVAQNYENFQYIFRTMLNGGFLGVNMLEMAGSFLAGELLAGGVLPNNRVAIVAEDLIWTVPIADLLKAKLPQMGFNLVSEPIRIAVGTTDFRPILSQIAKADAATTLTIFSDPTMVPFVATWAQMQVKTALFGVNAPFNDPATCQAIGGLAQWLAEMEVTGGRAEILGKTIKFFNAYLANFQKEPVYTSFVTYDTIYLLADAIARAGTTNANAVIAALEATDWVGASGRIQFYTDRTPQGQQELAAARALNPYVGPHDSKYGLEFIYPVQVQFVSGCGKKVIWPPNRKSPDYNYQLPPWMP
ncbi:MAG: ABC transporter substrate-binding protein [Candidatus Bipolaricaulia bacterium]